MTTKGIRPILPGSLRWLLRHIYKSLLVYSPHRLRDLAQRIPFSRVNWVLPRLLSGMEMIWWRGIRIWVNPGEVHGYYLYFLGVYSEDEIEALIRLCRSAHVLADVGANIGLMSLAVAAACPTLRIYAFEADSVIADRFEANLLLNPALANRITVVRSAIADVDNTLLFEMASNRSNTEVGHLTSQQNARTVEVPATRLDTFFQDRGDTPDIVKIDIEGAELKALQGMRALIDAHPPEQILVEVHGFYLDEKACSEFNLAVEALLIKAGYELSLLNGSEAGPASSWPTRIHILAAKHP